MSDIKELSDELAEEYGVPEPEMWGFLLGLEKVKGITSKETARELVERDFGE